MTIYYNTKSHMDLDDEQKHERKERLEEIVNNMIGACLVSGLLFLTGAYIFGGKEAREQIEHAFQTTVIVCGHGGTVVAAEILTGDIEPSVRKWLDYKPHIKADTSKYKR